MKKEIFLFLVFIFFSFGQNLDKKTENLPIIKSNIDIVTVVINEDVYPGWAIVPQVKPDRLKVGCKKEKNIVEFITDVDSIKFEISEGDTVQFYVLLNGKDSALTEIVGMPKNVNFSDEYIKLHRGKFDVEIPEVHELANIMIAISRIGQLDQNMVDMSTPYYKEVIKHFLPYKNHPMIDTINNHITAVLDMEKSYPYYWAFKMNACSYLFDKNNAIVDDGIIHNMGFENTDDPIKPNIKLIEDFARQSNFRRFYKKHQPYYNSLLTIYREINPVDKMKQWLETKFPNKYDYYRITFSPLVGNAHSAQCFEDNGFKQMVMFVRRAESSPKYNRNVNEMLQSLIVFTEIDHNYVNPVSDRYLDHINKALANLNLWAKEDGAYKTPYMVFNEYMTWAIFSLYCYDNYPEKDVEQFIRIMEGDMMSGRGFIKFDKFNQKLISLYRGNPNLNFVELYDKILTWCEEQ
jgi:hypothetical protein